jgi:hypothetical protein
MRRAVIDFDAELWFGPRPDSIWADGLSRVVEAMKIYGLSIVGSELAPREGVVRLVVEGSVLPVECEARRRLVALVLAQESHGRQRIVRVSALQLGEA